MVCVTLITCILLACANQADPTGGANEVVNSERLAKVRNAAHAYRLKGEQDLKLQPEPLLRFDDPVTKVSQGAVYMWADGQNRPAVMASIYFQGDGARIDEFLSLFAKGATAELQGQVVWQPQTANVELTPVTDTEVADEAPLRLVQMRTIARKHTAAVSDRRAGRQELRLLTKPLHRYAHPMTGLVDGGVFAFAKGTNPEVLLIIEAVHSSKRAEWRMGWARMTARECEVRDGESVVWSIDAASFPQSMNDGYFNRSTRE